MYKFFAPKVEQVRTDVYRQSQAHQDGTINDLQKNQVEWTSATPEGKSVIEDIVIHKAASYNGPLPNNLEVWINKIKRSRGLM